MPLIVHAGDFRAAGAVVYEMPYIAVVQGSVLLLTEASSSGDLSVNLNLKQLGNWTLHKLFQSILCAHDAIAQKDFYPHLPEIPVEVDEDEETIKIVQLVKNSEPLVSGIKFLVGIILFWLFVFLCDTLTN